MRRHCKKKTKKRCGCISALTMPPPNRMASIDKQQASISFTSPLRKTSNTHRKRRKVNSAPNRISLSKFSRGYQKITNPIMPKKQNQVVTPLPAKLIIKPKIRKLEPYEGQYKCLGLTPKEKMQIIGNCQSRSTRYVQLKKLAAEAIKHNKIFSVYGSCKTLRNSLVERGWVEKLPQNRMNMKNIHSGRMNKQEIRTELETLLLSNLVEKYAPSFIWKTKEHQAEIDMTVDYVPTVNKLQVDAQWTTKQGLCSTMKRNYWFYIEDVAEVYCPRTYNSFDPSEVDSFKSDFKITACTSLLKWVLSMVVNNRPVFVSSGTVSINVILFAVNRCKEYLYRKQNKDIDKTLSNVSAGQWNTFMKNYYRIISRADHFKNASDIQLNLYLSYAKFLLKEIHKYRPQLSCEGCHNIWIIKPAHCCRGRGIRMASNLEVVSELLTKAKAKYVVQKYIEEPLLIHDTKFDIRQYYLITSTCPLIIWMYKDCYLKFSTQKYNLKNYHESIHLTNNAVQKKYKNCENRHEELPLYNMWDSEKYISYLKKNGNGNVWDKVIYPGMKKAIISIVLACQDSMVACKNRFELYGCDFLLDKDYKPWLIEINSCPDLNHTTPVTAKICPAVIKDIIKVVIDYAENPCSSTGKFECIYRQPYTIPKYPSVSADLAIRGYSLPLTYFYKGKYDFKDPLLNRHFGKELDIPAVMKMLKRIYEEAARLQGETINEPLELPLLDSRTQDALSEAASRVIDVNGKEVSHLKSPAVGPIKVDTNSVESEPTSEPLHIVTPNASLIEKCSVDLRPLEDVLVDLSMEKINPLSHNHNENTKLNCPTESKSECQEIDAASQAVCNLLAFLSRKDREEREYNKLTRMKLKESSSVMKEM